MEEVTVALQPVKETKLVPRVTFHPDSIKDHKDEESKQKQSLKKEEEILFMDSPVQDEYCRTYGLGAPAHSLDDLLSLAPNPKPQNKPIEVPSSPTAMKNGSCKYEWTEHENHSVTEKGEKNRPGLCEWSIFRLLRCVYCIYLFLTMFCIHYGLIDPIDCQMFLT